MATTRPVAVAGNVTQPEDDGLFGPASVTWRVLASPASAIGGGTAVLMQVLHPRVLRLLDQTASDRADPAERARLTEEYVVTITYGDTASAERAGEVLRRIHSHRKAVDPVTGETYTADTPDLLLWVHATLVWGFLASSARWGPKLTNAERDRFVEEQRISARLGHVRKPLAPDEVFCVFVHAADVEERRMMAQRLMPVSGRADRRRRTSSAHPIQWVTATRS